MKWVKLLLAIVVMFMSLAHAFRFETRTHEIMAKIYDKFSIEDAQKQKIRSLLDDIFQTPPCQLYEVAELVIDELKTYAQSGEHQRKGLHQQKLPIPAKLFFDHFVTKEQINYLKSVQEKIYSDFSLPQKVTCVFFKKIANMLCFVQKLFNTALQCHEEQVTSLADRIFDYIQFERDTILSDYDSLLRFFVFTKTTQLPSILNFWGDVKIHHKLVRRVKGMTPEVKVQILADLFMLALQSYLMAGNAMYMQWLDQEDEDIFKKYTQKEQDLETNFQVYVNHLNAVQKNVVTQIVNGFKTTLQGIYDERKKANDELQNEELYLFKSINLSYPIQHALTWPPVPYDQVFEAGVMTTPKSHQWYNVYQNGDWEFNADTNSFSQNGLVPFGVPFWQKDLYPLHKPGQDSSQTDPAQNSIFTEYISNDASYDIDVECTMYNCSYPFFVGILFNKGRWISGDPERIWDYRLCGLYGTQPNSNDPTTRTINLSYAQQYITFDSAKKESIISPLEQIATRAQTKLFALPTTEVMKLATDAITFIISIKTSPNAVTITLTQGKEQLFTTNLSVKPPVIQYHGIGFMASGAQAEFKIIKPEKVVYSPADLKEVGS